MALSDNIVSYWKLDEASGNAADSVGSNTGTNTDVTYSNTAPLINNHAVFNGTTAVLKTPNIAFPSNGSITISFWMKWASAADYAIPFAKDDYASNRSASFFGNTGEGKWRVWTSGASIRESPVQVVGINAWHHIVMTWTHNDKLRYYYDGSEVGTGTSVSGVSINTYNTPFWFGADQGAGGRWFLNGVMDEIGYWTRALDATEVASLYNGGAGIQYPFAGSGPANLKTYNTNAKANIKTINTNPIANVKTLDTNA